MMPSSDLAQLWSAVEQRNEEQKAYLLRKVFIQMEFITALSIVTDAAYAYCDIFEGEHAGEVWARKVLVQMVMTATPPDEGLIQSAFQHYDTPGTANFLKGLHDLYQATQSKHAREARLGYLVSSLIHIQTAWLVWTYFHARREVWQRYRLQGEDFYTIALAFWDDPTVIGRDRHNWQSVLEHLKNSGFAHP
ncbi:MAG UNVERIFIED_CONTAM: hypothetical protein LVT10_10200 [Anaerolineae bacterium]|jgi:hypothetical protein